MKEGTPVPVAKGALPTLGHTLSLVRDPLGFVSGLPAQGDMVLMLITRTVTHDTVLGGTGFAAGTVLAYSPYLIHHRRDLYHDPSLFDPGRWQATRPDRAAYIPFGAGARKCIGDRLSLTQAVLAVAAITAQASPRSATARSGPPH